MGSLHQLARRVTPQRLGQRSVRGRCRCFATAPKPALDIRAIVADPEAAVANARARRCAEHVVGSVPRIVELHGAVSGLREQERELREERKRLGKIGARGSEEERGAAAARGKEVKRELGQLGAALAEAEGELGALAAELPNTAHPAVPTGGEEANVLRGTSCERGGAPRPQFGFAPRDHVELGAALGLFDFSAAAAVSGSKFVYLTGDGALLELALVSYTMQRMAALGYTPVLTPDLVKQSVVQACGFAPRGPHTQIYAVEGSDLALAATAEAPLAGMWGGQRIAHESLPIRQVGFGHCFRTEVGARGADVRGLYRLHQFSKVRLPSKPQSRPSPSPSLRLSLISA